MKIDKPGIYDLPADIYHGDPCVGPSIGSHGLRQILNECPQKFWWHSTMNPKRPDDSKKEFDVGTAAHDYIIRPDRFDEFNIVLDRPKRSNADKAAWAEAEATGKNVISQKDFETIQGMRDALMAHEFAGAAFINGQAEPSLFWKDEETGVWLRCRPDWLAPKPVHVPDYKTAKSSRPDEFIKQAYRLGYHQQAAHYLDGIQAVTGETPRSFYFVVQEKEPPYIVTCITLDRDAIEWGQIQNRKAVQLFARCLETGKWPGYADEVVQMPLPKWAEQQLEIQHANGAFS